ncbi:hypothetical protein [Rubrivirga sp.]|uniref:hypothetical protein n=1 Tax=Rubrivirga sp. TaxID=1885344 RepID=UPI003C729298
MSDQVPPIDPADERPQDAEARVPNPHRGEPVPTPEEGMRPGVDPAVRPEQDEEIGPIEGLLTATVATVDEEASGVMGSDDPEAEALLAQMGVEEEGIASGQLLGLVAATLASVAALAIILIYLFYIPFRTQVGLRADGEAEYIELRDLQAEGIAKLSQYTRAEETYGVPVSRAMGLVAARYGSAASSGLPQRSAEWNMLPVMINPGRVVQDVPIETDILPPTATDIPDVAPTGERVGQDVDADATVNLIDNDADTVVEDVDIDDTPGVTPLRDSN